MLLCKGTSCESSILGEFHDKRHSKNAKAAARLLPILSFMYLFNAIDRSNLGNAKTDTLLEDLDMTGEQYSVRPAKVSKNRLRH